MRILHPVEFSHGRFVFAFQGIGEPEQSMGNIEARVHLLRFLELCDRVIVAAVKR